MSGIVAYLSGIAQTQSQLAYHGCIWAANTRVGQAISTVCTPVIGFANRCIPGSMNNRSFVLGNIFAASSYTLFRMANNYFQPESMYNYHVDKAIKLAENLNKNDKATALSGQKI